MATPSCVPTSSGISALSPITPGTTHLPKTINGAAEPWSVPSLLLDFIRRPNSEKVIPTTRSSIPKPSKSFWNALIAPDSLVKSSVCSPNIGSPDCTWLAWVSNPPILATKILVLEPPANNKAIVFNC